MNYRIYLRALEIEDAEILTKWRNDMAVTSLLGGNTYFVSHNREKEWIKNATLNDKDNIRLAICLKENDLYIGNVNLSSINWINRSAEYSIMIGDKTKHAKGYGDEATNLILQYAFCELNLKRIYLTVREDNERALKLYSKIGFQKEGLLRKAVFKNNKYINMILMSILEEEFNGKY